MLKLKKIVLCLLALVLSVPYASSADKKLPTTSNWVDGTYALTRLVSATLKIDGALTMFSAVEIKLEPQWKTYWRSPGLAGIPPQFDFAGSKNLKKAVVLYPLPSLYEDSAGQTVGYKYKVLFPIQLEPEVKGEPIHLKVKFHYGVCKELCVPVLGSSEALSMAKGSSFFAKSAMRRVIGKVPTKLNFSEITQQPYQLVMAPLPKDKPRQLMFHIQSETKVKQASLFVEHKDGSYVPAPKKLESKDRIAFQLTLPNSDKEIQLSDYICTIRVDHLRHERPCFIAPKSAP